MFNPLSPGFSELCFFVRGDASSLRDAVEWIRNYLIVIVSFYNGIFVRLRFGLLFIRKFDFEGFHSRCSMMF